MRPLDRIGLENISRGWLGDQTWALYAVLVAAIWAETGFVFVVFLAGLQNVSKDLLEAATLDGANAWRRFWNVVVPQMSNVINIVTALLLIGGFSVFDIIFVMTSGGPNQCDGGDRDLHLRPGLHPEQGRVRRDALAGHDRDHAGRVRPIHSSSGTRGGGLSHGQHNRSWRLDPRSGSRGRTDDDFDSPGSAAGSSLYLVLIFFFLVFFVPFIWIWLSALKTSIEIARDPFALPTHIPLGKPQEGVDGRPLRSVHPEQCHLLRGDRERSSRALLHGRICPGTAATARSELGSPALSTRPYGAVPIGDDPALLPPGGLPHARHPLGIHRAGHCAPPALRNLPDAGLLPRPPARAGGCGAGRWRQRVVRSSGR